MRSLEERQESANLFYQQRQEEIKQWFNQHKISLEPKPLPKLQWYEIMYNILNISRRVIY